MKERWTDIPGCDGYQVTPTGRVRSRRGELQAFKRQGVRAGRYVNLYVGGEMRRYAVSTLVRMSAVSA